MTLGLESGFFMMNKLHGYASATLWKRRMAYTNTAILIDSSLFLISFVRPLLRRPVRFPLLLSECL
jgi:hypothetical protein